MTMSLEVHLDETLIAARVGLYTRTVLTSIHNTSVWSLTAAAPSDSVFHVRCTNSLTYLLTYFNTICK